MSSLPTHGRVQCTLCYKESIPSFDRSFTAQGDWRIRFNPLSWGSTNPEVIVLGFSKGPTQAGALATMNHNEIAYKGARLAVGKILAHVGLIPVATPHQLKKHIDQIISDSNGRFHFGSLVRCTAERYDKTSASWKGSGGGMLDKFVATQFGAYVTTNCASRFLRDLPARSKLIVMFGLGTKLNYVRESFNLFKRIRPGNWTKINDVAYSDSIVTVVHVEHFASQGRLLPNWLGEHPHPRAELGQLARAAVALAIGSDSGSSVAGQTTG